MNVDELLAAQVALGYSSDEGSIPPPAQTLNVAQAPSVEGSGAGVDGEVAVPPELARSLEPTSRSKGTGVDMVAALATAA